MNGVPRAELVVHGPGGPLGSAVTCTQVLIDTGATHSQIPDSAARGIGLNLAQGTRVTIHTANGQASRLVVMVSLDVQGVSCPNVPIYVGPNVAALVGRSAIYAAFQTLGVTSADWLRELYPPQDSGDRVAETLQSLRARFEIPAPPVVQERGWTRVGGVRVPRRTP